MIEGVDEAKPARGRIAWIVILCLLVVLTLWVSWVGVRAVMAKGELDAMEPLIDDARSAIDESDFERTLDLADEIGEHASRAAGLTGDPLWRVAEIIPVVGPNLAGVRVVSAQLDVLSNDVAGVVVEAVDAATAGEPDTFGGIDIGKLAGLHPELVDVVDALKVAQEELAGVDASAALPPVKNAVHRLSEHVDDAATIALVARDAAAMLPAVLGVDEPRTILLLMQNNAELRTGGGLVGVLAQLEGVHGTLHLREQASASDFPVLTEPILPVPASTQELFGDVVGRYVQNVSLPADFALTAELAVEWWHAHSGVRPDLVISIDPGVLAALLEVIGPVDVPGWGELNAENAVERTLIEPYFAFPDDESQNALFQEITSTMFEVVMAADANPMAYVEALTRSTGEGRISLWSADAAEQAVFESWMLGGPASRQAALGEGAFAVYANDATAGKMGSFLRLRVETQLSECRDDERREVVVAVNVSNRVHAEDVPSLPWRMTGEGLAGVRPGDMAMLMSVSAPPGWFFGGVYRDDELLLSRDLEDAGFPVSQVRVELAHREEATLLYHFIAPEPGMIDPQVLVTPTIREPRIEHADAPCA